MVQREEPHYGLLGRAAAGVIHGWLMSTVDVVVEPVVLLGVRPRPKRHQQRRVRGEPHRALSALSFENGRGRSRGRSRVHPHHRAGPGAYRWRAVARVRTATGQQHAARSTPRVMASRSSPATPSATRPRVRLTEALLGDGARSSSERTGTAPRSPPGGSAGRHTDADASTRGARRSPRGGPMPSGRRRRRGDRDEPRTRRFDVSRRTARANRWRAAANAAGARVSNIARPPYRSSRRPVALENAGRERCAAQVALVARRDPFRETPSARRFGRGQHRRCVGLAAVAHCQVQNRNAALVRATTRRRHPESKRSFLLGRAHSHARTPVPQTRPRCHRRDARRPARGLDAPSPRRARRAARQRARALPRRARRQASRVSSRAPRRARGRLRATRRTSW